MTKGKKTDFVKWMDAKIAADPDLARAVEERLAEMRIEQELVALREKRGLSRRDFAERIGTTQRYLARLESGKVQNIAVKTLIKYAAVTGTTLTVSFEPDSRRHKPAPRQGAAMRALKVVRRSDRNAR